MVKNIFDIEIDLKNTLIKPNDIELYGVLNTPILLNVDNVEYHPRYIKIDSTKPLLKNEVVVYVDNFKAKPQNIGTATPPALLLIP